jgi:hypothetical protein
MAMPLETVPSPKKSRKLRYLLAGLLVLLVSSYWWLPVVALPLVVKRIVQALEQPFSGQACMESFKFSLDGSVVAKNVELLGTTGRPMLKLESLTVQAQVMQALRGRYRAKVAVDGLAVHLWREPGGGWNWTPSSTSSSNENEVDGTEQGASAASSQSLNLGADLTLTNASITVHAAQGATHLQDVQAKVHWPAPDDTGKAALGSLQASFVLDSVGTGAPAGRVEVSGTFEPSVDLDPRKMSAAIELVLQSIASEALQPALQTVMQTASPTPANETPEGVLAGSLTLKLQKDWVVDCGGSLDFSGRWPMPAEEGRVAHVLEQQDAHLNFQLQANLGATERLLTIQECSYASPTATLSASGTAAMGEGPDSARADLQLTMETQLSRLIQDLTPLLPPDTFSNLQAQGATRAEFHLRGTQGRLQATGSLLTTDLRVNALVHKPDGEEVPLQFSDPQFDIKLQGWVEPERSVFSVQSLKLENKLVWGELSGELHALAEPAETDLNSEEGSPSAQGALHGIWLKDIKGQLTYQPDALGRLLEAWLPGRFGGTQPETVELEFEGHLADFRPLAVLSGVQGNASIGLGSYANLGFETQGVLTLEAGEQQLLAQGQFEANGGTMSLTSRLDMRSAQAGQPAPKSTLKASLIGLNTNPEVGQLLRYLHPAFSALDASHSGDITGLLTCDLDLAYDAPLTQEMLDQGFAALPIGPLQGSGRVEIAEASFAGSPLVSELMKLLGKPANTPVQLRPLSFQIQNGRIAYQNPWDWTVEGMATQFQGSIGLDGSLEMEWVVPISAELVRKHKVLKGLIGTSMRIPIGGSITRPRLDIQGVVQALAKTALEREFGNQLEDLLGKELGGLLGQRDQAGDDPAGLLKQADKLYSEGDKPRAAVLYRTLKSDHRISVVYLLNKSRIKRRARD